MTEISLEGLEFYAYHGYYKQEQEIGNKYSLDVKVKVRNMSTTDDLKNTIDYEEIYRIVRSEMDKRFKLLETIANNIIEEIFIHYTDIEAAEVSVSKFNPPLGGICQRARVVIKKERTK